MTLHQTITDKLYDFLLPLAIDAGINEVIFDYDNGVKITSDFIAVDIKGIISDTRPEVVYKQIGGGVENDELVNYRGTIDFAIDIYSNNQAIFIAEQMKAGLAREQSHENALKLNLGFVNYGDTVNLSAIEKGKFKHRSQFSMLVNYVFVHTKTDTTIGTVSVIGDNSNGDEIIRETITDGL